MTETLLKLTPVWAYLSPFFTLWIAHSLIKWLRSLQQELNHLKERLENLEQKNQN